MTAWLQHQSCKQQVIKKGDSSQVYLILVQRCGLEAISQGVAVRACQCSHSAICVCNSDQRQTSKSQVSPILAWVVAANALLQADGIKVSLLKASPYGGGTPLCSSLAIQHSAIIP